MTSSPAAYVFGTLSGAATPFIAGPRLVVAGTSAFGTSVLQDLANEEDPDFAKATGAAGVAVATGGFVRTNLGLSPLEKTGRSVFGNVSSSLAKQEFRHTATTESFGAATNALTQRYFQQSQFSTYNSPVTTPQTYNQSSGSSGGGGSYAAISQTLSNISSLISKIWGK